MIIYDIYIYDNKYNLLILCMIFQQFLFQFIMYAKFHVYLTYLYQNLSRVVGNLEEGCN